MRATPATVLLLAAALLVPASAAAQRDATLVLRILAHGTAEPIAGAQVRVGARGPGALSDAAGYARVSGIPPGSHVVEVLHVGYRTERMVVDFEARAIVDGEVELEVEAVPLSPVEVTADRQKHWLTTSGFYERQKFFPGAFLEREEIEELAKNSMETSQLLRRRLAGMNLQYIGPGRGYAIRSIRGGCFVQVLIDGVKVPGEQVLASRRAQGQTGIAVSTVGPAIDVLVPIHMIEAVEWYLGPVGVPPQFNFTGSRDGGAATCGTLVIWTRRGQ
jgi:hypothetical protein